jgi:hypothetical protein
MRSKLNVKQWLIASVAVFVAMAIMEYIVHGLLLASWYADPAYATYWRSSAEIMKFIWSLYIGYAFFALLFSYIFTLGYEGKPGMGEGTRYGFWIGLLIGLPQMFMTHATNPYPGKILIAWLVSGVIEAIILGTIVGAIYKTEKKATA